MPPMAVLHVEPAPNMVTQSWFVWHCVDCVSTMSEQE
jgi:hypothetical protein